MNNILKDENIGNVRVGNSYIRLNALNKPKLKLINLGNKTRGIFVITVPLIAAKKQGYKKVSYNIANKAVNHNEPMNRILNYLGFNKPQFGHRTLNLSSVNFNTTNYKKYMNEHRTKNNNNKIKKFNQAFQKRRNIVFERPSKYVRLVKTLNGKSKLQMKLLNNVLHYNYGITEPNARGKGHGKLLRSLPINIARQSGYKKILQTSVWENKNQFGVVNKNNTPPSRRILERLGFKIKNVRGLKKNKAINSELIL
jgi:hypothetical protein